MKHVIKCIECERLLAFLQDTRTIHKHYRNIQLGTYYCYSCDVEFYIEDEEDDDVDDVLEDDGCDDVVSFMDNQPQRQTDTQMTSSYRRIGFSTSYFYASVDTVAVNRLKVTASAKDIKSKLIRVLSLDACVVTEINLGLS